MIIQINSLTINDPTTENGIYVQQLDGLDIPPVRTSSGNYGGRDGGYIGAQFYSARPVTITGRVFAVDVTTLETRRKDLIAALKGKSVTLRIVTNAGYAYLVYAKLIDFAVPINRELFEAPFKIELLAGDPTIYDDATGVPLTASLARYSGGGYVYPVVFPVIYSAGAAPTSVTNAGDLTVKPVLTLTGKMTNPIIKNLTTGQQLAFTGLTTGASASLVIDMAQMTALLDGGNVFGLIQAGSTFWGLQPGPNSLQLTSSDGADTVTGVVSWRSGLSGI